MASDARSVVSHYVQPEGPVRQRRERRTGALWQALTQEGSRRRS
jgi:hypothetical protein